MPSVVAVGVGVVVVVVVASAPEAAFLDLPVLVVGVGPVSLVPFPAGRTVANVINILIISINH